MEKKLCELCEKKVGAYSTVRKMFICESCHHAMGLQEARYNAGLAQDLTGQDAEVE